LTSTLSPQNKPKKKLNATNPNTLIVFMIQNKRPLVQVVQEVESTVGRSFEGVEGKVQVEGENEGLYVAGV
jgi:hypothetical protein